MRTIWRAVASLSMLVAGCASPVPVTDGSRQALPSPRTVTIVWGNHPTVSAAGTTWLLHQGLVVIEQAKLQQILAEASHAEAPIVKEAVVLNAAKTLGAKMVVFITQAGDARAPIVAVRAADVDTTQILWSGSARYPEYVQQPFSELLVDLTYRALAVAWGHECAKKEASCAPST